MSISLHDNWVYAHAVDYERSRIVLHTVDPHRRPPEYTDVLFEGVVVHHFEQQKVGGGPYPANVLFGVGEADPSHVLREHEGLLGRTKGHGWPVPSYDTVGDLVAKLTATGAKCFRVTGAVGCGLDGFVFAATMQLRTRSERVELVT